MDGDDGWVNTYHVQVRNDAWLVLELLQITDRCLYEIMPMVVDVEEVDILDDNRMIVELGRRVLILVPRR